LASGTRKWPELAMSRLIAPMISGFGRIVGNSEITVIWTTVREE
jgi:hypothetical protein